MGNDFNHGAEKLIDRILADARAEADKIAADADKAKDAVIEDAKLTVAGLEAEANERARALKEETLERARISAGLDSRKHTLMKKRELVEEAFVSAERRLMAMEGEKRDKLLSLMLVNEAEGGEKVVAAKADAERIARLIGDVNKLIEHSGKKALSLDGTNDALGGGFILVGQGYEKNCSFAAMLRDIRGEAESRVADILFI